MYKGVPQEQITNQALLVTAINNHLGEVSWPDYLDKVCELQTYPQYPQYPYALCG